MRKLFSILFICMAVTFARAEKNEAPAPDAAPAAEQNLAAPVAVTKADADSAYVKNDFVNAIDLYETILKTQGESADIYYNLGNAYFKAEQIAKSILNYERAILLKPGDSDIRFNLEMAQSKTVDKVVPMSEVIFITWIKDLTNLYNEKTWGQIGIVCFILLLASLSLYLFSKGVGLKKAGFFAGLFFLFICVVANLFASAQKDSALNHQQAIIMAPSVTVKSTPNESGTDLFVLHEGRKVTIKDSTMKEWTEIELEDGNAGWMPSNQIEVI